MRWVQVRIPVSLRGGWIGPWKRQASLLSSLLTVYIQVCFRQTVVGMSVQERLNTVRAKVEEAARNAGRNPDEVRIMAVSKFIPAEQVLAAVEAGQRLFGENRWQGTPEKIEEVAERAGNVAGEIEWHFIGRIQSNKARRIANLYHMMHGIDSVKLVEKLGRIGDDEENDIHGLVQVNVTGTLTQGGIAPQKVEEIIAKAAEWDRLKIRGLMAIAPLTDDEYLLRRAFERVRIEAERIDENQYPDTSMEILSMGMSGDFEYAVQEGSTLVRIGTAIFGPREEG
ncbi:YggS family pyridoxal phosphate-dependent enzyme [bacterium]|nr:YggS family pyridoxal phosphate-dependent enzyme [bacterium]